MQSLPHSPCPSTSPPSETRPAAPEVDRCAVTGTHDSGDLLENLLDELAAGLGVLVDLETHHREDQRKLVMLYTLERKAKAASLVYAIEHDPPAVEIAAPHCEPVPSRYAGGGTATDALRDVYEDLDVATMALRAKRTEHQDQEIADIGDAIQRTQLRLMATIREIDAARAAAVTS